MGKTYLAEALSDLLTLADRVKAIEDLMSEGRRCVECGKPLFGGRTDRQYCDRNCQVRAMRKRRSPVMSAAEGHAAEEARPPATPAATSPVELPIRVSTEEYPECPGSGYWKTSNGMLWVHVDRLNAELAQKASDEDES